ncbi:unnamed protein product, partial [Heterosigma akashiwo]
GKGEPRPGGRCVFPLSRRRRGRRRPLSPPRLVCGGATVLVAQGLGHSLVHLGVQLLELVRHKAEALGVLHLVLLVLDPLQGGGPAEKHTDRHDQNVQYEHPR